MKTSIILTLIFLSGCINYVPNGTYGERKQDSLAIFTFTNSKCKMVIAGSRDGIGGYCNIKKIGEEKYALFFLDENGNEKEPEIPIEYDATGRVLYITLDGEKSPWPYLEETGL